MSSIFTEMVGVLGTPPMPVYGFLGAGFGGAGDPLDVDGAGVTGGAAADFLPPLLPLQAAAPSSAAAARVATMTREGLVMSDPLP